MATSTASSKGLQYTYIPIFNCQSPLKVLSCIKMNTHSYHMHMHYIIIYIYIYIYMYKSHTKCTGVLSHVHSHLTEGEDHQSHELQLDRGSAYMHATAICTRVQSTLSCMTCTSCVLACGCIPLQLLQCSRKSYCTSKVCVVK